MQRCTLNLSTHYDEGYAAIYAETATPLRAAVGPPLATIWQEKIAEPSPARLPIWLDVTDDDIVEVHSALPMRYYLQIEQYLGIRLPCNAAPCPQFLAVVGPRQRSRHVVLVATTSMQDTKQYGLSRYAEVARHLLARSSVKVEFTVIVPAEQHVLAMKAFDGLADNLLAEIDAADCVDIFGSADIVIGNDTGLTHLAALTVRTDGTVPNVVSLYAHHSYLKWATGSPFHHAIATSHSQMLAFSDADLWLDGLSGDLWGTAGRLDLLPSQLVANFSGHVAG